MVNEEPARTLSRAVGGSRRDGLNATWPFARLVITEQGIRIEGTLPLLRLITPTASMRLAEVRRIERLTTVTGVGLRFVIEGRSPIIFWQWERSIVRAINVVERLGIPVVEGGWVWF
jgi:hypothetical protein